MAKKIQATSLPERINWIDIARGIGIILVIYGHLISPESHRYLIYAFHMPLFFFLSGLVFKPAFDKSLKEIVVKNFKQLMIPYFLFAIFTYLYVVITKPNPDLSPGGIGWQLFGMLYGSGSNGMLGFNVVLWFLPCLFVTRIGFSILTRNVFKSTYLLGILFTISILGYILSKVAPWIKLPFGLEIALTGIVFFGLGNLWKRRVRVIEYFNRYRIPLLFVGLIIFYFAASANFQIGGHQIDLRASRYNNYFLFYIAALSGIFCTLIVSQLIKRNKLLEYLGSNSLVLFVWHNVIIVTLQTLTKIYISPDLIRSAQFFLPTIYAITVTTIILVLRDLLLMLKRMLQKTSPTQ